MNNLKLKFGHSLALFSVLYFALNVIDINAQSTNQTYPTAVTTNEISGKIVARDIGDARLTSYFYIFNGSQGDIFINLQTSNFNGDIDISTADSIKSFTKITVYADISQNETGRVIYLRKPEKLLMRIQGRTPNDDPATFQIKFAGSFETLAADAQTTAPELPEVKTENPSGVRVNSVGTIIEVKPKPTPAPKETVAKIEPLPKTKKPKKSVALVIAKEAKSDEPDNAVVSEELKNTNAEKPENNEAETVTPPENKNDIIEAKSETEVPTEVTAETKPNSTKITITSEPRGKETLENTENNPDETITSKEPKKEPPQKVKTKPKKTVPAPPAPNALENIRLIVLLKNGTKIEHPMSDVFRFDVTKGILTVITKDGKIERYSILDVEKTIIE